MACSRLSCAALTAIAALAAVTAVATAACAALALVLAVLDVVTAIAEFASAVFAVACAAAALTPSELRVALALLGGKTPGAIAPGQGVSLATVRTHLSRLYHKTDTGGQASLVLAQAAAMPSV